MIIDMHCHFVPGRYFDLVRKRHEFELAEVKAEGENVDIVCRGSHFPLTRTFFDPERQLLRMKKLGIDRTVISLATPLINYYVESSLAVEAARLCNDGFAELISSDPKRFAAWAFLPMQDPQEAAAELRRCVIEHGFVGGHVATNVRGAYLPDERFQPVFDAAVELDVPLFVHPADAAGRERTGDYELTVVAGYLFDTTINIFRMICSGFLDRYPGLKLVCAHVGGYALMLRGRMQREIDTNPALSRSLPRPVGDYLSRLYYDAACFEADYLKFAATIVPSHRLFFGTDAPFLLVDPDPVGFIRRAMPQKEAEQVLGGNFTRLIGH